MSHTKERGKKGAESEHEVGLEDRISAVGVTKNTPSVAPKRDVHSVRTFVTRSPLVYCYLKLDV